MDFPAYTPAAVRAHITSYLNGEKERHIPGYADLLASAESELAIIEHRIKKRTRNEEFGYQDSLREQKAEAVERRDWLAGEVDCLRRLAHDARMRDAFALLTREFTDDQQWCSFIYAAWTARVDYSKYRDRLKQATELKGEIADAADTLAKLIRRFADTGLLLTRRKNAYSSRQDPRRRLP
jgi:hypothetical protein